MEDTRMRQLRESSTLSFARSLFNAAEAKGLFEEESFFPSAVSAYYSLFHLGASVTLAYCSTNLDSPICVRVLRKALGKNAGRQRGAPGSREYPVPDPAEGVSHNEAPQFLKDKTPGIAKYLGMPGEVGNLRDMREFVSYAPRLRSDGHTTILYSGCHYTADDFVQLLGQHISRIDERFAEAMQWFKEKSHDEVWSRLLTSDFILHEYDALRVYYRKSVQKGVGDIYRSLCEAQDIDWKVNRPDPGTWTAGSEEEEWRRRRHQEIIDSWIGPT